MRQLDEAEIRERIQVLHEEAAAWRRSQAAGTASKPLAQSVRSTVAGKLRRAAEAIDAVRPEDRELQVIP